MRGCRTLYSPYIARAAGGHKWDVDGNRYVDFFGGHGALILGHAHPDVTAAIAAAAPEGTQFGASHPREVAWAQQISRMVPSAERIRFTSSGTEATLMALRLARAFTGRPQLLRFIGHFHGWHDHMTPGYASHFDGTPTPGVLAGVADGIVLAPPGDLPAVERLLARGDVAAVILEPTGASFGQVPLRPEFLHALRAATERAGTLLILDEVVTGFRVSPGGAQGAFGVRPGPFDFREDRGRWNARRVRGGAARRSRPARCRGDRGGRARAHRASGHVQREPGFRCRRHCMPARRRRHRCL